MTKKKAPAELADSYRRLVEGLKSEYFFYRHGRDGVFNYVSPAVRHVLGYSPENFLKHYTRYLTGNPVNQEAVRHTKKSLRGEKQPPYPLEVLHKNGSARWLEVLEVPVKDGRGRVTAVEGIAHDITRRARAEKELDVYRRGLEELVAERTAELKAVFDRTPVLLMLLDEKLRVIRTNSTGRQGRLIGEVLKCVRSREQGCGRGAGCGNCVVRRAITGTMQTGRPVLRVEAYLDVARGGRVYFLLSSSLISREGGRQLLLCLDDITLQKQGEESLRKAEEFRRLILASVGDGILGVDAKGGVLFLNEAAQAMLGWSMDELKGKDLHALLHYKRPDGSPYPLKDCPMHAAYKDGQERVVHDETLWRKDGTPLSVRYSARPMSANGRITGAVVTFSDTSERRRMEAELRANKERLQVHNAALTGLGRSRKTAHDADEALREAVETCGSALGADRASIWLFSTDRSEISCRAVWGSAIGDFPAGAVLKSAGYPVFTRLLQEELFISSDDAAGDFRLRELRETLIKPLGIGTLLQAAILNGGKIAGFLSASRRTGAAPWTPDEQSLLGAVADFAALALAAEERKKLEGMKDFLTHAIVHDLKNPLAAISLAGQMMASFGAKRLNTEQRENLDILNQQASFMNGMISNILDINRMEEGKMPLKAEPLRPYELLKAAAETLAIAAAHDKKKIRVRQPSLSGTVPGDQALLKRVAENLLANALRYTPEGGEVEAGAEEGDAGDSAVFFVRDRGPGIPAEYRDTVFDKFTQLDDASRRRWGGKGLGLAFCKLAVEAHGGRIWIESEPGRGSVFRFSLPRRRPVK
ncbi:MAG: hypothetical protein A2X32_01280 [Elusimicrobia bacterium GWC2_64_44]|nr:MAG: hypothetical protein A2X32_01280 [Elusimicrobia bacterium GWC2_64_44]